MRVHYLRMCRSRGSVVSKLGSNGGHSLAVDLLVVMGDPMNIYGGPGCRWRVAEKRFIERVPEPDAQLKWEGQTLGGRT